MKRVSFFLLSIIIATQFTMAQENTEYYFTKKIQGSYEQVFQQLEVSVKANGFGIIDQMDMQAKLKEKLGSEVIDTYMILGVCNPNLAFKAIQAEPNIGVFLPCKIVIRRINTHEFEVATINPTLMMGALNNEKLNPVANEVAQSLKAIIENL